MERRAPRPSGTMVGRARTPGAPSFLFSGSLLRLEVERRRVHAVAQPSGPGTIRKHVSQMRIAAGTARLGASHAITGVSVFADVLAVGGGKEARPSGSRIKFRLRAKEQCATADAVVRPVVVFVPILSGESALGAATAGHLILLRGELLLPLGFGLGDLVILAEFFGHVVSPSIRMKTERESCKRPLVVIELSCVGAGLCRPGEA